MSSEGTKRIIAWLVVASRKFGQSNLAGEAGITRQGLADILSGKAQARMSTLKALINAATSLELHEIARDAG